ncbi:MAG: lytic transglycosylase domain-containing protein [Acidobacteriia bacterium]|nr:lytic transglycosylase domain-containing protein [Terriglobia bacterium]
MHFRTLIFVLTVSSAFAGEYALLAHGGRLHADRHEHDGAKVRLYNGGGYIEIESSQIVGYEAEESAPAVTGIAQTAAPPVLSPQQLADTAADRYGLPRTLVRSVMSAESGFQPHAVSPKGALGLMQLMPATAQALGANASDSAQNVDAGARYLRQLLEKYHGALYHALAAYNAGPAAVDKYKGVPPFPETVRYVNRVAGDWKQSVAAVSSAGSDPASPPE